MVITVIPINVNSGYYGYNGGMPSDKPFLSFVVEPDLLKRLDDFRFANRFESRAQAIKWLLDAGLSAKLKPKPTKE